MGENARVELVEKDNPLCGECSPQGMIEEQAYWAWREAAESAGYMPDTDDEDELGLFADGTRMFG